MRIEPDILSTQKHLTRVLSRIGGSLQQLKLHSTVEGLVELLLARDRPVTVEELLDGSWYDMHPEMHNPLCRIDGFLDLLVRSIPSLNNFAFRVHHTARDLGQDLEMITPSSGHALTYNARISRPTASGSELSFSSRTFPDNAQEAFRDLCYCRIAEYNGISAVHDLNPAAELHDDFGPDVLRYEREEDIEAWETEDEWL